MTAAVAPPRADPIRRRLLPDLVDVSAGWQPAISRGARIVVGLTTGFAALGAIGPALEGSGGPLILTPGSFLLMASMVALLADLAVNHNSRWGVTVVVALYAAGLLLTLTYTVPEGYSPGETWWPNGPTSSLLLYAVVMTRRTSRWLAVGVILALHVVTRLLYWPDLAAGPTFELWAIFAVELGGLLMLVAGAVIGIGVVTRVARHVDRAVADERAALKEVADKERKDRRSRAVDRFVHDEVLHVLRTIALDRDAMPAAEARAGARRLASLLDAEAAPAATGRTGLAERLAHSGTSGQVRVTVEGDEILLPDHIEDAFAAAVGEALHNVALHAGVSEAFVVVAVEGDSVEVRVTDHGRGFTLQRKDGRHGIEDSIIGRMRDVGGDATVSSAPGEGTTVTLTWAPRPDEFPTSAQATFSLVRRFYPAVVTAILPFAVGLLWTEAWLAATLNHPVAGWISITLTIGLFAALAAKALRRGLTWRDSLIAALVAWGATHLNGVAVPVADQVSHYMWISGGTVILMALISQFRPPWESVVIALGVQVGMLYASVSEFGWEDSVVYNLPTITMPILGVGVALTVRWVLETMARAIGRSEAKVVRGLEAATDRTAFMDELGRRVGRRHEAVGAFIDGVASGAVDVADPGVRARAAELERTIRESLFAPPEGILDRALRRARERGLNLEVRVSGAVPAEVQDECARALETVSGGAQPASAQLTVMPGEGTWRISLTADGLGPAEVRQLAELEGFGWTLRAHEGSARAVRLVTTP